MKESTGELSMTVITIVAIVIISGFVTTVVWPLVSNWIESTFNELTGTEDQPIEPTPEQTPTT